MDRKNHSPRPLAVSREYPGYQFYARLSMEGKSADECLCYTALVVQNWLCDRIKSAGSPVPEPLQCPLAEDSRFIKRTDLRPCELPFAQIRVSEEGNAWSLTVRESDPEIWGRAFITRVGVALDGQDVEFGVRIDVVDQDPTRPELDKAYRPQFVRLLFSTAGLTVTQIEPLRFKQCVPVESGADFARLKELAGHAENQLPLLIFTRSFVPGFDAQEFSEHIYGFAQAYTLSPALLPALQSWLSPNTIKAGDAVMLEPECFGGAVRVIPNRSDKRDDWHRQTMEALLEEIKGYSKGKPYRFGSLSMGGPQETPQDAAPQGNKTRESEFKDWDGTVPEAEAPQAPAEGGLAVTPVNGAVPELAYYGKQDIGCVRIPEDCTSIGAGAFAHSSLSDLSIPSTVRRIEDMAFCGLLHMRSLVIPEGVEEMGNLVFSGCIGLQEITLPASLKRLGTDPFYGCEGLKTLRVPKELYERIQNEPWAKKLGEGTLRVFPEENDTPQAPAEAGPAILTVQDVTRVTPFQYSERNDLTEVIIKDGVRTLCEGAFKDCASLTRVVLPAGLRSIPASCFAGCDRLQEVVIGNALQEIKADAFADCRSLRSLDIPSSCWMISPTAFRNLDHGQITLCVSPGSPASVVARERGFQIKLREHT